MTAQRATHLVRSQLFPSPHCFLPLPTQRVARYAQPLDHIRTMAVVYSYQVTHQAAIITGPSLRRQPGIAHLAEPERSTPIHLPSARWATLYRRFHTASLQLGPACEAGQRVAYDAVRLSRGNRLSAPLGRLHFSPLTGEVPPDEGRIERRKHKGAAPLSAAPSRCLFGLRKRF